MRSPSPSPARPRLPPPRRPRARPPCARCSRSTAPRWSTPTALDLFSNVLDVWDLVAPADGAEDEVAASFQRAGLDFRGEVVPAYRAEPFAPLEGARRVLASQGGKLVTGVRLATLPETQLDAAERRRVSVETVTGGAPREVGLYVAEPLAVPALEGLSGATLMRSLAMNPSLAWRPVELSAEAASLPRVVLVGGRRYGLLTAPSSSVKAKRLVLIERTEGAGAAAR